MKTGVSKSASWKSDLPAPRGLEEYGKGCPRLRLEFPEEVDWWIADAYATRRKESIQAKFYWKAWSATMITEQFDTTSPVMPVSWVAWENAWIFSKKRLNGMSGSSSWPWKMRI